MRSHWHALQVQSGRVSGFRTEEITEIIERRFDGSGSDERLRQERRQKARRDTAKESTARPLEKYDKSNEYSKINEYGKGYEKGKDKGEKGKGKGKGQGKDERPPNSSFQGFFRSCGKWVHKASECWQDYVQGVEEVPSSSASSVAPSAAATLAAAKAAPAIQKVNDENEPGWICGMVDGSLASVTTDRDDMWDELVLDSGANGLSMCMVLRHKRE